METVILILQTISALIFTILVLSQNRGDGLGSAFGGMGGSGFYATKRGAEKIMANATIIMAVLFLTLSFVAVLI